MVERRIQVPYHPRREMLPYHDRMQRFACIVAHRRLGKTTAALNDLQRIVLRCPHLAPRGAFISPLLKQSKEVAWDILKRIASPLIPMGASIHEGELRIDYPNSGRLRLYGADNPDALRGIYLDGVVLDEYAQMKPSLYPEVLLPALGDRQGKATFIGTPKGRDAFYQVYREAQRDPVTWYSAIHRASETGYVLKSELELHLKQQGQASYDREYECSFDVPAEMQFISGHVVNSARHRSEATAQGPKLIGVDISRSEGGDWNVILYRNGDRVPDDGIVRFRQSDTMQTVGRVAEVINRRKPDAVFIDSVGVGGPVADRLRQLGFAVIDINSGLPASDSGRFKNLRSEMWWNMRDWLRERGRIPHDEPLMDDLTAPLYRYDSSNRTQLESKDDMKGRNSPSPDTADALALTFAQPVASRDVQGSHWGKVEFYTNADEWDAYGG
jgi:hypothetical protein